MRWLFRTNLRSFYLLNATQFTGALNDNIFKLLVIYLLISVKGPASANIILSLAGAIFVIPFLLFSSGAGVLADRISKRSIIVFAKCLELTIMLFSCAIVYIQWEFGLYAALFLLATHSAIFGPSKYGIIPELVEQKMVSRANGSLTSLTYLAMILGTFLASFLTEITNKNFVAIAGFCTFVSIIGLITALGINKTEPGRSKKKINPFFFYEIYQTVRISWKIPHLLPCIFGSSFFLFIGAFTQLNMIPFAMQSLHLSEVGGGYLFLATAIGIAIGSVLCGRLSKDNVEPGISCIAGVFIGLFFLLLSFFSFSLIAVLILLTLLGIVGGCYLVPFDSYLQVNSPIEKRGQIIAASNFFSFIGVLMAAVYLYLVSENFGFSASSGFALLGVLSLIANVITTGRFSSLFFPFFAKKILKRFRKPHLVSPLPDLENIIFLQSNSWWDAILLYTYIPRLKIFIPGRTFRKFPWVNGFIDSFRITPHELDDKGIEKLSYEIQKCRKNKEPICLFIHKEKDASIIKSYHHAIQSLQIPMSTVRIQKEKTRKSFLGIGYPHKQISIKF